MRYPQVIDPATQPKQSYPVLPDKQFRLSDGSYDTLLFQKPFNNAAMPLEYGNNKAPPSYKTDVGSSKTRVYSGESKFVGFVDNYVAHPIDPAYQAVVKSLEYVEKMYKNTANDVAENLSYKPLGAGADSETMNSLRDKMRFLGASESDIEEAIRMEKRKRLENAINTPLTPQQQTTLNIQQQVSQLTQQSQQNSPFQRVNPETGQRQFINAAGQTVPDNRGRPPTQLSARAQELLDNAGSGRPVTAPLSAVAERLLANVDRPANEVRAENLLRNQTKVFKNAFNRRQSGRMPSLAQLTSPPGSEPAR